MALQVDDLAFAVDPETCEAVVKNGRGPGGVKRRLLDFVLGARLAEVGVLARIDKPVVASHGFF